MLLSMLSAKSYNTPFINVDETIQLKEGMTKQQVLNTIGDPFYVDSGDMGIIVWIYEVRAIEVQSDSPVGEDVIPNKTHKNYKHTGPIHRLEVVFVDNRLESWQMIEQKIKKKSLPGVALPQTKVKTSTISISPYFQIGSAMGIGLSVNKGTIGAGIYISSGTENDVDSTYISYEEWEVIETKENHSATTIMGKYNYEANSLIFEMSAGLSFISVEETRNNKSDEINYRTDYHTVDENISRSESGSQIYFSIGIGKRFRIKNFNIQPMLQAGLYNEDFGISAQCKFNFML